MNLLLFPLLHNIRYKCVPVWVAGALLLLLMGCQQEPEWHSRDISNLMPSLAFELTDETGNAVTEADFSGQVNLLFFGFTQCPDICPTTLAQLAAALRNLSNSEQEKVQVLFVSVDPERDSSERLREYTDAFGARFIGLTGTEQQLRELNKRYRVTYGYDEPDSDGNYNVSHSSAVFAFDLSGQVRLLIRDDIAAPDIASDVKRLLSLAET